MKVSALWNLAKNFVKSTFFWTFIIFEFKSYLFDIEPSTFDRTEFHFSVVALDATFWRNFFFIKFLARKCLVNFVKISLTFSRINTNLNRFHEKRFWFLTWNLQHFLFLRLCNSVINVLLRKSPKNWQKRQKIAISRNFLAENVHFQVFW